MGSIHRFVELRWYTIKPSHMQDYVALTGKHFGLRVKHSPLLGFWTMELGGLNQVFHMWSYESAAHRKHVRDALSKDPEWLNDYVNKMLPCLESQRNVWTQAPRPDELTGDKVQLPYFTLTRNPSLAGATSGALLNVNTLIGGYDDAATWALSGSHDLDALIAGSGGTHLASNIAAAASKEQRWVIYPAAFCKPYVTKFSGL